MKILSVASLVLLTSLVACKKKGEETPPAPPPPAGGSGSAMAGSGSGSAAAGSGSAAAAKPVTGDDLAKRYVECWGFLNAKDMDKFKTCYAPNIESDFVDSGMPAAKSWDEILAMHNKPFLDAFPDFKGQVEVTLINGKNGATFGLITGKHTGPLKTPMGEIPPTNKNIGLQVAHVVHFADDGKSVDKEQFFEDMGEMMGQLGLSKAPARPATDKPWHDNEIVVAKDDATEKRNLENTQKGLEAFNKHDTKSMNDAFADDLVWSEIGVPKDWNKKEAIANHEALFKGFSNLKITPAAMWAAGDYVVATGTFAGKNDGPVADMGIKKPTNKEMSLTFCQLFKYNKDGKLVGSWGYWNSMKFAMDLGMMPPPAAPKGEAPKGEAPKGDDKGKKADSKAKK